MGFVFFTVEPISCSSRAESISCASLSKQHRVLLLWNVFPILRTVSSDCALFFAFATCLVSARDPALDPSVHLANQDIITLEDSPVEALYFLTKGSAEM